MLKMKQCCVKKTEDFESPSEYKRMTTNAMDIIQLFLDHPYCNVNVRKEKGKGALHLACEKSNMGLIETLMSSPKIDINAKDEEGRSVLFHLLRYQPQDDFKIVKYLLADKRCDVNAQDHNGVSILSVACREVKNLEIVEMLLKHEDITVDLNDNHGRTCFHEAVKNHNEPVVKLLLQDPRVNHNIQDKLGNTAMYYAVSSHGSDIFEYLIKTELTAQSLELRNNVGESILSSYIFDFGKMQYYEHNVLDMLDALCHSC